MGLIMRRIRAFGFVAACMLISTAVFSDPSPKISGKASSLECLSAFQLAKTMFYSKASRLYAPLKFPEKMDSQLVLGASALDISGGKALDVSEEQFEELPQMGDGASRSVYWGRHLQNGVRIVVQEEPVGWRGDMYSLYLFDASVDKNEFLKAIEGRKERSRYPAQLRDTWRPPLVFLHNASRKLWFIVVGEPYQVLADWRVYKVLEGGAERACVIRFIPEGLDAKGSLPATVRKFAHLLDETLGPGNNEGTLQPTAGIRIQVANVWANAGLRPWALADSDTYNSTDEVTFGLEAWSQKGSSYRRIYAEILRIYPIAEVALGDYYKRQFQLPKDKANKLAKWVLDIAFRAHYAFTNGQNYFRYLNVNTNPWFDENK